MHKISVLSHINFDNTMSVNDWTDINVDKLKDTAFISICCLPEIKHNYLEEHLHETDEHWFKKSHDNVLNVEFDDIVEDYIDTKYGKAIGISEQTAKAIVEFINKSYNKGIKNWYLHCRSGKSRSVAVGVYLMNFLKNKNEEVSDNGYKKDKANEKVLNMLTASE